MTWDAKIWRAGGLRGGVVLSPTTLLLMSLSVVYRVPLDRSSQPMGMERLHAAIGRPASISLQRSAGGHDRVWIFSQDSAQMAMIDPGEKDPGVLRLIKAANDIRQVRWLRDGTLVANGFFATETLRLMRVSDDTLTMVRSLSASPFPNVTPDIAINLNRNRVSVRADEQRIAQAFLYVPRIRVYSPAGDILAILSAPDEISLKYDAIPDPDRALTHFIRTDETQYCYVDVASDLSHIYALFSGHSRNTDAAGAFEAELLDVFDWNGRFEGRWALPYRSVGLVADVENHRLFILTRAADAKVVQIALRADRDLTREDRARE
jgi:hypothetical protein